MIPKNENSSKMRKYSKFIELLLINLKKKILKNVLAYK